MSGKVHPPNCSPLLLSKNADGTRKKSSVMFCPFRFHYTAILNENGLTVNCLASLSQSTQPPRQTRSRMTQNWPSPPAPPRPSQPFDLTHGRLLGGSGRGCRHWTEHPRNCSGRCGLGLSSYLPRNIRSLGLGVVKVYARSGPPDAPRKDENAYRTLELVRGSSHITPNESQSPTPQPRGIPESQTVRRIPRPGT